MPLISEEQNENIIDRVSVGTALSYKFVEVTFHEFGELSNIRGEFVESPTFNAHGHDWRLEVYPGGSGHDWRPEVYPGGSKQSSTLNGQHFKYTNYLSVYLKHVERNDGCVPTARFIINIKGCNQSSRRFTFNSECSKSGYDNFYARNNLDSHLEEDRSLIFKVKIKVFEEKKHKQVWFPQKNQQQCVLTELYNNASSETADVIFIVEKKEYHAHKNILAIRAKTLFEMSMDYGKEERIHLPDVKKETFQKVLEFIYAVKAPDIKDLPSAKELLIVADKFDCAELKLLVESTIVDKFLTMKNAATMLLFSDSHSCALLTETAMTMFTASPDFMKSEDWLKVKESSRLVDELFELGKMDVVALREKLQKSELPLDGSRQVLIERLKQHQNDE